MRLPRSSEPDDAAGEVAGAANTREMAPACIKLTASVTEQMGKHGRIIMNRLRIKDI